MRLRRGIVAVAIVVATGLPAAAAEPADRDKNTSYESPLLSLLLLPFNVLVRVASVFEPEAPASKEAAPRDDD